MKTLLNVFCIAVATLAFAACGSTKVAESSATAASPKDGSITEKYWKLIEINGRQVVMGEKMRREPHIILKEEGLRLTGTGGCNNFSGTYAIEEGSRIRFSSVAATMMSCADMGVEADMLKLFEQVDNYSLSADGKYLSLNRARMAPLARFEVVYLK